jgi:hypothetical protein
MYIRIIAFCRLKNLPARAFLRMKFNPAKRDAKKLADQPLLTFLACIFLGIPLIIFLLPVAIFSLMVKKLCCGKKPKAVESFKIPDRPKTPLPGRPYDMMLFGATGFTGSLAAKYIAEHTMKNTPDLKWAMAGRRKDALEKVRDELKAINPACATIPIVVVDSLDVEGMANAVLSTRVAITTVGPFLKYGTLLVALCAEYGTSYADITGETPFLRNNITRFDEKARQTGARIVHMCGHDCVPWDLMVQQAALRMKQEHKDELAKVELFDSVRSNVSGGTLATVLMMLVRILSFTLFTIVYFVCTYLNGQPILI